MSAPRWQVVREVWNADGCLIDSSIQAADVDEHEACSIASASNDLEEDVPTYDDGHKVTYYPELVAGTVRG